jgi:hypothetical protein
MKKLFIILLTLGVAVGANAQHRVFHGGYYRPAPRVVIGAYGPFYGYGFYSPFYNPWFGYPGYPVYRHKPTKLEQEIADIRADYEDKIWSAKQDLKGKAKRQEVRALKHERDQKIAEAERDYYKKDRQPANSQ